MMSNAIEKLAAEMGKLSAEEWARVDELRSDVEFAERLREIDRVAVATIAAGEALADSPSQATVRSGNQT